MVQTKILNLKYWVNILVTTEKGDETEDRDILSFLGPFVGL